MAASRDPFGLTGVTIDGKVRVEDVVGEGGFGVVYRAMHEGFGVPVALKCLKLPPHFDAEAQDDLIRRLREEGRLLLKLSQRTTGILQALDVGAFVTPGGARVPYLVLEWLDGHTLTDEITKRARGGAPPFSLAEAMKLLEPAAKALALAHEERIAHRDIKPDNLFIVDLGTTRTIKVLDFGIAKVFAEAPTPDHAATGAFPSAFTPAYGAPEQFDKRHGATGPWTDVYALALVLVELVTLKRALPGETLGELFQTSVDPVLRPTPRSRGCAVSDEIEGVFAHALDVDPTKRVQSAGLLWEALERALAGGGELVPPAPRSAEELEVASAPTAAAEPSAGPSNRAAIETGDTIATSPTALPVPGASLSTRPSALGRGPSKPLPRALWVGALSVAAIGGVVAARVLRVPDGAAPVASASVSASGHAESAIPAVSRVPEAEALYREALHAWRDGAIEAAVAAMSRAVALDRALGAGHLRLALWKMSLKETEAREHYQTALLNRDGLGEHDRALLEAAEPFVRQPWDLEAWSSALEKLVAASPDDLELRVLLGQARYARLDFAGAIEAYDRALAIDPDQPVAWIERGEAISMQGDAKAQLASYDRCLEARPGSAECLSKRVVLRGRQGQCEAMRDDARELTSRAPSLAQGFELLANALLATGERGPAVEETLAQRWALLPEDRRRTAELQDRAAIAVLDGDFDRAAELHDAWIASVSDKRDPFSRGLPVLRKARLFEEIDRTKDAGELATEFLARMKALPDAIGGDMSIHFVGVAARTGALPAAELASRRSAWLERYRAKWVAAGRKTDLEFDWIAWSTAYGGEVRTQAEAEEAKRAMPKERSRVVDTGRWTAMDLNVGRVLVLTGDPAGAIEPLRRAATSCHVLDEPMRAFVAQLYLGLALEKTGDHAGAKKALETVVSAWGKKKSRSRTAKAAALGLSTLKESAESSAR